MLHEVETTQSIERDTFVKWKSFFRSKYAQDFPAKWMPNPRGHKRETHPRRLLTSLNNYGDDFVAEDIVLLLVLLDEFVLESKGKIRGLMIEFIGITTMVVQISKFTGYLD